MNNKINNKPLTSMAYALYMAVTGKEPPPDITRGKARAVIRNRMAKKRSKLNRRYESKY